MRSRFRPPLQAVAGICGVGAIIVACSNSSSPQGNGNGTSSLVEVVDAGFPGCAALEPGCYTTSGTYPLPNTAATCPSPGGPAAGAADTHCEGVTPQAVDSASCVIASDDAGPAEDAGPPPAPGPCGENGSDYGTTMFGTSGGDDDCKYHVSYTSSPVCENDGTYFVVTASYLTRDDAPLTGACTFAELCLNDTHPAPGIDARPPQGSQKVVEGPPGTYTIGPVTFDAAGQWTVRFHFNELCCDVADDSPHGHAAFFVDVP
jgi:hypothetical protein